MARNKKFRKYFKEYTVANVYAMIKNNRRDPEICDQDFKDKLVVITGATSAIGVLTAKEYAAHGANILMINRNEQKSIDLSREIESEFGVSCTYKIADLSSLEEVHSVAEELAEMETAIDVLIHNAGVYLTRKAITKDGLDMVLMVHHLSSFIFNYRLKEKLSSQDHARIILVSSEGHRFAAWGLKLDDMNWERRRYTGLKSYGSAKTAQLLSMFGFTELYKDSGVLINAMHPGAVKTETGQENGPLYRWYKRNVIDRTLRSADISATSLYYLGVSKEVETVTGKFFNLTTIEEPAPPALDQEVADELWDICLKMAKLN